MDNASELIQIFIKLESWMRERADKSGHMSFPDMIANLKGTYRQINVNSSFLEKIGKLRNVLVHEGFTLAEPSKEVVCKFRSIVELIMIPPRLLQYCAKEPFTISEGEYLPDVLHHMCDNDYSQVIVKENENYRLLSREGVSKWVEANISNEFAIISGTTVAEVLSYEDKLNCKYVDRFTDVFVFLDIFSDLKRRVQAVIITEHGKSNEKPIGIATAWDAGKIIKELNIA